MTSLSKDYLRYSHDKLVALRKSHEVRPMKQLQSVVLACGGSIMAAWEGLISAEEFLALTNKELQ